MAGRWVKDVLESIPAVMIQLHKETSIGFQISELPLLLICVFLLKFFDAETSLTSSASPVGTSPVQPRHITGSAEHSEENSGTELVVIFSCPSRRWAAENRRQAVALQGHDPASVPVSSLTTSTGSTANSQGHSKLLTN